MRLASVFSVEIDWTCSPLGNAWQNSIPCNVISWHGRSTSACKHIHASLCDEDHVLSLSRPSAVLCTNRVSQHSIQQISSPRSTYFGGNGPAIRKGPRSWLGSLNHRRLQSQTITRLKINSAFIRTQQARTSIVKQSPVSITSGSSFAANHEPLLSMSCRQH